MLPVTYDKVYTQCKIRLIKEIRIMDIKMKALLLELLIKEDRFTGRSAARLYNSAYDEHINWHEFSDYLSHLYNQGLIKVSGHDTSGMIVYTWNR